MFRPIRRKKNEISEEAAICLLQNERRGVLAVHGDDGFPYAIPINFWLDPENRKIYFHGSKTGHKADALRSCDKVCFTVFGNEHTGEETWAPFVQSAVVFGRCRLIDSQEEAIRLVKQFARKYFPTEELVEEEAATSGNVVQMFEITIEHLSGKEIQER